jgi:[ribosomal protein S5]-alanine N-acetyltransferase
MPAPERFHTKRLVLRKPAFADASAIFTRYASDPQVTRFLAWHTHRSLADTQIFLEFSELEWKRRSAGPYLIDHRHTGELLGSSGLAIESDSIAATGYVLAKDAWGKGYATEALRAMTDIAAQLRLNELYALCHPENKPSVRVLEKCGFRLDPDSKASAIFPNLDVGTPRDCLRYVFHPCSHSVN